MNPKTKEKNPFKMIKLLIFHEQKVLSVNMKKIEEEALRLFLNVDEVN